MLLYLISLTISIPVVLLVFVRNPRSSVNRSFLVFTLLLLMWMSGTLLDLIGESHVLMYLRVLFVFALFMAFSLYVFAENFTGVYRRRFTFVLFVLNVLLSVLILTTGLITASATYVSSGDLNIERGILYIPMAFVVFLQGVFGLYLFATSWKRSRGAVRSQLFVILLGFFLAILVATLTNLIIPIVSNSVRASDYLPLSSMLLTFSISYAIVRHHFLGISGVVVRAVGYLISTFIFMLAYSLFIFAILYFMQGNDGTDMRVIAFLSMSSVLFALLFQPLRNIVGRVTSKVFFQDTYDSQSELDKLTGIAVSRYKVEDLVTSSLRLINSAVKASKGSFIVLDGEGGYFAQYDLRKSVRMNSNQAIDELSGQMEQIFYVDTFEITTEKNENVGRVELYNYLKKHDVSLSIRLSTKDMTVGYLLLGPKLSGNLYSRQDVQFLSIAANELSIAIQNARRFDEIQEFNATLKTEINDATKELRTSNKKLKDLDNAKDEFITMASHQLRTPLTSVKGYLSMVLEGDTGEISPKQRKMLTAAFTSSQRMVYLIADLLNVSRLQTGKFIIEPAVVDLVETVKGEITQLEETAKGKKLSLKFHSPKDNFPKVMLDENKIRQVMMNFMDNAIYYTPAGGHIDVYLDATDKKIEFRVEDDGIGVPKKEQHNLFTKFYRAQNARTARPDGTGLGLFMAKKVVVDQGGAIIFKSKEGKGSAFGFEFPLSKVRPSEEQLESNSEE